MPNGNQVDILIAIQAQVEKLTAAVNEISRVGDKLDGAAKASSTLEASTKAWTEAINRTGAAIENIAKVRENTAGAATAAKSLKQETDGAAEATKKLKTTTDEAANSAGKLKAQTTGWLDALKLGLGIDIAGRLINGLAQIQSLFRNAIKDSIDFNATLEAARLGVAAVLKQFNPGQYSNFQDALKESGNAIELLKQKALESPATFKGLVEGFQAISGAASGARIPLSKQVDLIVLLSQALAGLGIRNEQLIQESRSLLTGNINENAQAAKILGITSEQIHAAREAGTLYEFLTTRLSAFAEAGKIGAGTFNTAFANLGDTIQQVRAELGVPLFESLRQGILDITKNLVQPEFKDGFRLFAEQVGEAGQKVVSVGLFLTQHASTVLAVAQAVGILSVAWVAGKLAAINWGSALSSSALAINPVVAAVAALAAGIALWSQAAIAGIEKQIELTRQLYSEISRLRDERTKLTNEQDRSAQIDKIQDALARARIQFFGASGASRDQYAQQIKELEVELARVKQLSDQDLLRAGTLDRLNKSYQEQLRLAGELSEQNSKLFESEKKRQDTKALDQGDTRYFQTRSDLLREQLSQLGIVGDKFSDLYSQYQNLKSDDRRAPTLLDADKSEKLAKQLSLVKQEIQAIENASDKTTLPTSGSGRTGPLQDLQGQDDRYLGLDAPGAVTRDTTERRAQLDALQGKAALLERELETAKKSDELARKSNQETQEGYNSRLALLRQVAGLLNNLQEAEDGLVDATKQEASLNAEGLRDRSQLAKGLGDEILSKRLEIQAQFETIRAQQATLVAARRLDPGAINKAEQLALERATAEILNKQAAAILNIAYARQQALKTRIEEDKTLNEFEREQALIPVRERLIKLLEQEVELKEKIIKSATASPEERLAAEQALSGLYSGQGRLRQDNLLAPQSPLTRTSKATSGLFRDDGKGGRELIEPYRALDEFISGTLQKTFDGLGNAIAGWLTGTLTWGQAFLQVGNSIIAGIVNLILEYTVFHQIRMLLDQVFHTTAKASMVGTHATGETLKAASTATSATAAGTVAAASAPAAAGTSIWSFGSSATIGLVLALAAIAAITAALAFEEGGSVPMMPGTTKGQDGVLSWLAPGEFVIPEPIVSRLGSGHFEQYRQGRLPAMASGGVVNPSSMTRPAGTGQTGTGAGPNIKVGLLNTRQSQRDFMKGEGIAMVLDQLDRRGNRMSV